MPVKVLDISGKVSPYCLAVVAKEAKAIRSSGELLITCDNFHAVTTAIPRIAGSAGLAIDIQKPAPGHWEIRLTRE